MREAGIEKYQYIDWFRDHPIDDDLKLYAGAATSSAASRTSRGSRSTIRSSGKIEIGGWNRFHAFSQSAAAVPRARARALPEVDALAGADLAEAGAGRTPRPMRCGDDNWRVRARRAEHRLAAELRVEARARAQGGARRRRRDRAAGGRDARARQAARGCWASSKARRTSTPASRSGPTTTSPTIASKIEWVVRGEEGRAHRRRRAARERRRRARERDARLSVGRSASTMDRPGCVDRAAADRPLALLAPLAVARAAARRRRRRDAGLDAHRAHRRHLRRESQLRQSLRPVSRAPTASPTRRPTQYTQVDRDGTPLPHLPPVWKGKDARSGVSEGPAEQAVPHRRAADQPAAVGARRAT